jgi:hypothetical protein
MSIFRCSCCQNQIDSDFYPFFNLKNKDYCQFCFENKFACEDCGGFENKEAAREFDGYYCVCNGEEKN